MKQQFRRSVKNYCLSEKNELLYKIKEKVLDKIKNKFKNVETHLKVPTVKALNNYLFKFHTENFHYNSKDLIEIFKSNKIGYYGITKVIEEYVSQCPVCMQTVKNIKRPDPVKAINVNGPNFRYEFDLTYLNDDLSEAYGVNYILSVIDVFSRKAMEYKHNIKESKNLLRDIIEFCINNGYPKEFVSDNGPEFKNNYMNKFCIREGIKYIHGIPYNPHFQGTVERFHYTIKKYLTKEYINNNYKKLDFDSVRIRVINYYNNKKNRLIGMTPLEASKLTNFSEIKKVNELKEKEFAKINSKRTYIDPGKTCFLNPNFILIGKNTILPNYIKKGKYKRKIPVKVLSRAGFGYYKIKLFLTFKDKKFKFKKGDEYIVDTKLLKIINEKTWKSIVGEGGEK